MERQFGIQAVNLTREPTAQTVLPGKRGRAIKIDLPRRLMEMPGILFSVPVLKTHAFTVVTLGLKNLWGCIPSPHCLLYHACLPEVLSGVLMRWGPGWSLTDGAWVWTDSGRFTATCFH